ncbi:putative membrane-associated protein [Coxiella burnetii str. Namibia]|nr:putative membrane-associated protein [Coxiella burnetii str. Namibia]
MRSSQSDSAKTPLLRDEKKDEKEEQKSEWDSFNADTVSISISTQNEWLDLIAKRNTETLFEKIKEQGLPKTISEQDDRQWSLFHYLIATGYYKAVLHLLNMFPIAHLNKNANDYTPLDLALLMGQRRIATCLRLVGFQHSPAFHRHPFLRTSEDEDKSAHMALSFWAVVNNWEGLLEKLLSGNTLDEKYKQDLIELAHQLDNLEVLRHLGNQTLLIKTVPLPLSDVFRTGQTPSGYLKDLMELELWNVCLHFLLTEWPCVDEERQQWAAMQLSSTERNPVILYLQAEKDPIQTLPAIASAIVEGGNLYAFYLLWKQVDQDKLAVLDAWRKENQQAKALCVFSPEFNESALINALIYNASQCKAVFEIESSTAILRATLQEESIEQLDAVVASLVLSKGNEEVGQLAQERAKKLPIFLLELRLDHRCMLTQAALSHFLLTKPLLRTELEWCFALLTDYDMSTLQSRIKKLEQTEIADRQNACETKAVDEQNKMKLFQVEIQSFFTRHRIPIVIEATDSGSPARDMLSCLPNGLFNSMTLFLNAVEKTKLATLNTRCHASLTTSTLFSASFAREAGVIQRLREIKVVQQVLTQIIESEVRRTRCWRVSVKVSSVLLSALVTALGAWLGFGVETSQAKTIAAAVEAFMLIGGAILFCFTVGWLAINNSDSRAWSLRGSDILQEVKDSSWGFIQRKYPKADQQIQNFLMRIQFQENPLTVAELESNLKTLAQRWEQLLKDLENLENAAPNGPEFKN